VVVFHAANCGDVLQPMLYRFEVAHGSADSLRRTLHEGASADRGQRVLQVVAPFSGISEATIISCCPDESRNKILPSRNDAPCCTSFFRLNQKTCARVLPASPTQTGSSAFKTAKSSACWFSKIRPLAST